MIIEDGRSGFYQWDQGQRIMIENYPAGVEVHFSIKPLRALDAFECDLHLAMVVESYEEYGYVFANIPNRLLQVAGELKAYIYTEESENSHTAQCCTFNVLPRLRPADYVYTETQIKRWEDLDDRLEVLEKGGVGTPGKDGIDGKSAYEYAKEEGYTGSEEEFAEKLAHGFGGLHIGASTPPATAEVWVDPNGVPTSVENWEFDMDDGTTDEKTVVVVGSDEAVSGSRAAILRVRQADGSWVEIPALVGAQGPKGDQGEKGATGATGATGAQGPKGDTGATGASGKDGSNGVSATHSWNGTTLTITSASGTSSADLKGDKGDKGDPGSSDIGIDLSTVPANALIRKSADKDQLSYTRMLHGAMYCMGDDGAVNFGALPLELGGTGIGMVRTSNAIIRYSGSTDSMASTPTANGAFYATGDNAKAVFGTLPVAQGGTGATNATTARTNLGLNTENWTFTLEDGSVVTKAVCVG